MPRPQRNVFGTFTCARYDAKGDTLLHVNVAGVITGSNGIITVPGGGIIRAGRLTQTGSIGSASTIFGKGKKYQENLNKLSQQQINALQLIYDAYSHLLAKKEFEKIHGTNYVQYAEIIKLLKAIQITNHDLKLLIDIAENALVGSVNVGSLYTSYVYNEIKVALLQKRIKEVLSDKNTHNTATSVTGQFTATQTFTLAPMYSYYIYVYGMPEFGVGFDPVKLAFIKALPQFSVLGQLDKDPLLTDMGGNLIQATTTPSNP